MSKLKKTASYVMLLKFLHSTMPFFKVILGNMTIVEQQNLKLILTGVLFVFVWSCSKLNSND